MAIIAKRRVYIGDATDGSDSSIWDFIEGTDDGTYGSQGGTTFSDFLTNATTGQLSPHQVDMLQGDASAQMLQAGGTPAQANSAAQSVTGFLNSENAIANSGSNLTLYALLAAGVMGLILAVKR